MFFKLTWQVKNAEAYGASGVLLFDDPNRSAPKGAYDQIYPNGDFLPKDGVQRGSLNSKEGDPSTPVYPSISIKFLQIVRFHCII